MKKLFLILMSSFIFIACSGNSEEKLPEGWHKVEVNEILDTPTYSIMNVEENGEEFWIATSKTQVQKGEVLYYEKSMQMTNFKVNSLNRTFDKIQFVDQITKVSPVAKDGENAKPDLSQVHEQVGATPKQNVKLEPVQGGITVANAISDKANLNGKTVKIKGTVTKINMGIMDRNWIHIQDGTESNGEYDLVVTSTDSANVNNIIVVEGTLITDKDFGSGYKYDVLIEDAKLTKSK